MTNVSVIMATYKEPIEQLKQSIESILNQSYKDIEFIIILDNPSNQIHIDLINEYKKNDNRIVFEINDKNQGLTYSLNKGLKLAKGKYIARMDADDISLPTRLQLQLDYLEKNNCDLIGGLSSMVADNGEIIYAIQKVPTDKEKIKKLLKYNQVISHPTWFGKKEVFDKLNGYREMPLCEDYDFTLRAVLDGYVISNINECVLYYRMSADSLSRSNLYEQFLYCKYITHEYSKGNISNIQDAKKYVSEHYNEKKAKKYSLANVRFNKTLNDIQKKHYLKFIKDGFQLTFTSKAYLNKIYRFAKLLINS
ncbi:MAG: glycosyltransferase [Thomasclavelia sp.]|nr:glycosyltransferase [Thomasclavelia sp.]